MGIRVLEVEPEHVALVERLHREHYWRSHCLLLNRAFYDWQFAKAPGAGGRDRSIVALDDDGTLLSFLGVVPMKATHAGRVIEGAHLISWLSPPAARGRGVGMAIMQFATAQYEFLFGRSVTPAALTIYRKLGFRYLHRCKRWLLVLDPAASEPLAVAPDAATSARLRARVARGEPTERFHVARGASSGTTMLAQRALAGATGFVRDHAFLDWRYVTHPLLDYQFLHLGTADDPRGVAVVRVETVRERPGRVLRVLELLAEPGQERALASAIVAFGRGADCAYADAFGVSERFVHGLVSVGGFDGDEEESIRLPHLLQPWDPDCAPPGVLFYGRAHDGSRPSDDLSRMHVTKGDGNMDWPSWVPVADGPPAAPATGA